MLGQCQWDGGPKRGCVVDMVKCGSCYFGFQYPKFGEVVNFIVAIYCMGMDFCNCKYVNIVDVCIMCVMKRLSKWLFWEEVSNAIEEEVYVTETITNLIQDPSLTNRWATEPICLLNRFLVSLKSTVIVKPFIVL